MRIKTWILFLMLMSGRVLAQPGDPPDPNDPVPISGIEILLVSGGLLGIRKILGRKKN